MKTFFTVSILILTLSAAASAATVQMSLGQNAQINSGDVAIVTANGQTAVVVCAGSSVPVQPSYQDFEGRAVADLMLFPKPDQDDRAKSWCLTIEPDYTADLRPAVKRALDQAMNQCQLAGFAKCQQLGQVERRYVGFNPRENTNQCALRVFVRGTR